MTTIPPRQVLIDLYQSKTDFQISQDYKVSPSTVRRWRRYYSIASKPRGPRTPPKPKITDDMVRDAVPRCLNFSDLCRYLGLSETGSGHASMKTRVSNLNLNISHFDPKKKRSVLGLAGYRFSSESLFVFGFAKSSSALKKRLISDKIVPNECSVCHMLPMWNNQPLVFQLDHIDGNRKNNLTSNLRLLCPNCHTQTVTYAGRNKSTLHRSLYYFV